MWAFGEYRVRPRRIAQPRAEDVVHRSGLAFCRRSLMRRFRTRTAFSVHGRRANSLPSLRCPPIRRRLHASVHTKVRFARSPKTATGLRRHFVQRRRPAPYRLKRSASWRRPMATHGRELPVEAPSGSCLIADTGNTSGVPLPVSWCGQNTKA
jgi:hypothetical protein